MRYVIGVMGAASQGAKRVARSIRSGFCHLRRIGFPNTWTWPLSRKWGMPDIMFASCRAMSSSPAGSAGPARCRK